MRNWFYIAFCLMILACSKQENTMESSSVDASDVMLESAADEVMMESEDASEDEFVEETPITSQSTKDVLSQQLQETLNLIVLNNKVDLSADLKTELNATINQKVADYALDESTDVLEINKLQITAQSKHQNQSIVEFEFDANNAHQTNIRGHGTAQITVNAVTIDDVIYQEYQIYFPEIIIE